MSDIFVQGMKEVRKLNAEICQLRAELAAIRDAGDEEVDDICRPYVSQHFQHIIENDEYMRDIAKARGLKIAEQETEIERLLSERETGFAAEEACRTLRSVIEGTKKHTAELIRERDEAIGLLKWVVDKFTIVRNILPQMANYDLGEGLVDVGQAKRILELTAK